MGRILWAFVICVLHSELVLLYPCVCLCVCLLIGQQLMHHDLTYRAILIGGGSAI